MKREIKFRAKRIDNGQWVYGSYIEKIRPDNPEPTFWASLIHDGALTACEVDPETVCQYTGLKDKNGVEIYEGDKVIYPHTDCENVTYKDVYEVIYLAPMFKLKAIQSHIFIKGAFIYLNDLVEVIGNIHTKQ